MQLVIGITWIALVSTLLFCVEAKPTFDRLAEVLLDTLDDRRHYERPYVPIHPSGPLIQEGYDHGYDYYYGGGSGHGYGSGYNRPYGPPPPPPPHQPPHGYYQQPVHGPPKGYYPPPQQYPYSYAPQGSTYAEGYGSAASVGGYKKHGY